MRAERKQKKKKRILNVILLTLVLLICATVGYAYLQYKQGMSQSLKLQKAEKQSQVVYHFNGQKDQYGNTNILLLGADTTGQPGSRSDTIMIASYNQNKGTFKLASIMRDSYVAIPGHGKHKINAAFAYGGPELLRQTILQNFGVDIQYYAIIDFQGFVHVIDEAFPNGVEVNVEKTMSTNIGETLHPGPQRLNGKQLLGYVRFRHDAIGDFGRVARQQKTLQLIGQQLSGFQTLVKLPKLMGIMSPYVNTNMRTTDILSIAKDYLTKSQKLQTIRIPINNSFALPYIPYEGDVIELDIAKNRQALNKFLAQ